MRIRDKFQEFLMTAGDRQTLYEHEIKEFLGNVGISVPKGIFVPAGKPLPLAVDWMHSPLTVKTVFRGGGSKSEAGGVQHGISKGEHLEKIVAGFSKLEDNEGVLIEETMPPGFEVIVGGAVDPEFGPIVMFGMGGFLVELFHDVSFALAPVSESEAHWLINETKGSRVLNGFRGKPPLDVSSLSEIIVVVSELMATGLVHGIDLNPVAVYPSKAVVLDAKLKRI